MYFMSMFGDNENMYTIFLICRICLQYVSPALRGKVVQKMLREFHAEVNTRKARKNDMKKVSAARKRDREGRLASRSPPTPATVP